MARVKLRNQQDGNELVGQAIFDAWEAAIVANPQDPVIDREALLRTLEGILDTAEPGRKGKKIEFDLVFDTDLDKDTRLVWISIPTPDTDLPSVPGGRSTWRTWKQNYYDNLSPADQKIKRQKLGEAVLFACGR